MDIKTIMLHLELEKPNDGLYALAQGLAARLEATAIIGVAGCQPLQLVYEETYAAGEILAADREQIEAEMRGAEQRFRDAFKGKVKRLEWRSNITPGPLADYMANEARAADLLLTCPDIGGSMFDHARQVKIADLVFRAGRPVLLAPPACTRLDLGHVLIGWKDAPECRRATQAALPFLALAEHVSVVSMAGEEDDAEEIVEDVVGWLSRHGIDAEGEVVAQKGDDAGRFAALVRDRAPGLVVAGAYGHSRVREWALGGVTGDYLMHPDRPVLLSH